MNPPSVQVVCTRLIVAFGTHHPPEIARTQARECLRFFLEVSAAWIASNGSSPVSKGALAAIERIIPKINAGQPLAQIIGQAEFYGNAFSVSRYTLIPRPETEMLVDLILGRWPTTEAETVCVDIGTGTGCIGTTLALKRHPKQVVITDVSKRALMVASQNVHSLVGSDGRDLKVLQGSLLSRALQAEILKRRPRHLLIASNLPYLPFSDRKALAKTVTAFEPHRALFGGTRGDELVVTLLKQVKRFAKQHQDIRIDLVLEYDPPQTKSLLRMAKELFPEANISIEKDGFERERFLCVAIDTKKRV